jgi:hypothetical protein
VPTGPEEDGKGLTRSLALVKNKRESTDLKKRVLNEEESTVGRLYVLSNLMGGQIHSKKVRPAETLLPIYIYNIYIYGRGFYTRGGSYACW